MTNEQITLAAREICAEQAQKQDNDDWTHYLSGRYDHTVLMRLVEQGIRRGLEWQTMVKTQHCPNCEATEQKLHDFHQEVGDIVEAYVNATSVDDWEKLKTLIIPKPKPDPLVVLCDYIGLGHTDTEDMANDLRAALEAAGFEIREKGQ